VVVGCVTAIAGELPLRAAALLGCVAAQRIVELALSRRHIRLVRERASESATSNAAGTRSAQTPAAEARVAGTRLHWRAMIAVHAALVILPALEVVYLGARAGEHLFWCALAAFLAAQGLRYWSIASLGVAWNARAVIDPLQPCISAGPYRWIRHPNYLAVLIEFSAVPLALGAWRSWILLNVVHAPILARRIRAEEALLAATPGYAEAMLSKGRFVPRRRASAASISTRNEGSRRECS
jgi:methyltransferase